MSTAAPAVPVPSVRFAVASRPMKRYSAEQTVSNLAGPTSLAPIPLPATGHVRKVSLYCTFTGTCASAGAVVAGDGPWNLLSGISLSDATGQPIVQPISGYNLYLVNKYLPSGIENAPERYLPYNSPHVGPEYAFSATATSFTARFRLDLEFEIDSRTGYGSIPNLDANASLQLKIDVAPYSVAFSGTTVSAASLTVRVEQHYWAPVAPTIGGQSAQELPPGFGDFVEYRYENQNAVALSENTAPLTARGGLIRGVIAVSRAAGVRTAFSPNTNVGLVVDNTALYEGIRVESWNDEVRRSYGYIGADVGSSYAPLSAGILPGLDTGVLVFNFDALCGTRGSWLPTKPGSLVQAKFTPGASATQIEFITAIGQVKDAATFYGPDPA